MPPTLSGNFCARFPVWRHSDLLLHDFILDRPGSPQYRAQDRSLGLYHSGYVSVFRALRAAFLRHLAARAVNCRGIDRRRYGLGHGHVARAHHARESHEAQDKEDISLTPLAMPLMSGPGAIGVVMGFAARVDSAASYLGMVIGIAGIALSVLLFFWLGGPLVRRLGPNAVGAINKIFGFLILAIAVQLVWDGVADFNS